jgi:hypothetical protein
LYEIQFDVAVLTRFGVEFEFISQALHQLFEIPIWKNKYTVANYIDYIWAKIGQNICLTLDC